MSQDELVPSERGLWTVEVYEDADGTQPFASWLNRLSEAKFVALDAAIRLVLSERGLDLARTEWLKPLGEGLHEFRVRHDADEIEQMFGDLESRGRPRQPILLRVFVHFHGSRIVLLLGGYDKGRDPSDKRQEREIKRGPQVSGGLAPPGEGKEEGQVGEWAPDLRNIFTWEGLTEYGENPIMSGEEN